MAEFDLIWAIDVALQPPVGHVSVQEAPSCDKTQPLGGTGALNEHDPVPQQHMRWRPVLLASHVEAPVDKKQRVLSNAGPERRVGLVL